MSKKILPLAIRRGLLRVIQDRSFGAALIHAFLYFISDRFGQHAILEKLILALKDADSKATITKLQLKGKHYNALHQAILRSPNPETILTVLNHVSDAK